MSQERVENLPTITSPEALVYQTGEEWKQNLQDPSFLKALPKRVQTFIEEDARTELSQEQRENAVRLGLKSYIENPQEVGKNLFMNNKGEVGTYNRHHPSSESNTEPQSRAGTSVILIWGINLTSKEYVATTTFKASQKLSSDKRNKLYDNIFRVLRDNSPSRDWIKQNNLDVKSGVDWDEAVPYIGLFPYRQNQRLPVQFREDLNPYAPKALEKFILHVIKYINNHPPVRLGKKRMDMILPDFAQRLKELTPEARAAINPELLNQAESLLAKPR